MTISTRYTANSILFNYDTKNYKRLDVLFSVIDPDPQLDAVKESIWNKRFLDEDDRAQLLLLAHPTPPHSPRLASGKVVQSNLLQPIFAYLLRKENSRAAAVNFVWHVQTQRCHCSRLQAVFARRTLKFTTLVLYQKSLGREHPGDLLSSQAKHLYCLKLARNITSAQLFDLAPKLTKHCPHLRKISLSGCQRLSVDAIHSVFGLKTLTSIDFSYCPKLSDQSILFLISCNKNVRFLNIAGCPKITMPAVQSFLESKTP
jgi:hypothetical protein